MLDLSALMEQAKAAIGQSAREQGILTMGDLRGALGVLPANLPVVLDTGMAPTDLASYRGYYERLSFGWGFPKDATALNGGGPGFNMSAHGLGFYEPGASSVDIKSPPTCSDVLEALNLADGERFEGYKGGQFEMDAGSFLHVANYGDTGRCVSGVRVEAEQVVILTAEEVW